MLQNYYLGGPLWANKNWVGHVYPSNTKATHLLRQYATIFNTVEGSTTFYSLPNNETIQRWRADTPAHFRFSFKFPEVITHQRKLHNVRNEMALFLRTMEPLTEKIGNLFIQLPPNFDRFGLEVLQKFLLSLPPDFVYSLEVRHLDFYTTDYAERLNDMLRTFGINRAMFDTVELFKLKNPTDEDVIEAQRKKPRMPEYFVATAQNPFLRYVGHKTLDPNTQRLEIIATKVAEWIRAGLQPFVYFHTPSDYEALHLARYFHQILAKNTDLVLGTLPPFGAELHNNEQGNLF